MKAILVREPGDADVMALADAPAPAPRSGDLVVRVHAAGVNRADLLQRRGSYAPPEGASSILGLEVAGEVVTPAGNWQEGDRVMAVITGGGYAETTVFPAGLAMRIPDNLSYTEAAAIPEAFLTAYLNLFTLGNLQAGQRVLIHAGASGVGSAAIQLAKAAGARVFTTAGTPEKRELALSLGAEIAINYREDSFGRIVLEATEGQGVDLVLDFIGEPYWNENLAALARGGRLLLIGFLGGTKGQLDIGPIMRKNLTVTGTTLRATRLMPKVALTQAFVDFALPKFASGALKPIIDSVYPLEDAAEAHRRMEANANIGKIVLAMNGTKA